jgi:hypothetical protein
MIAVAKPKSKQSLPPAWHKTFLKLLPAIQSYATAAFGHLNAEAREEAVAEAVAHAMIAIINLIKRRKDPTAFPGHLARFAVLRVKAGRLVAGQSANDALSQMAQQLGGFTVSSLDDESCDPATGWKEAASTDTRSWPVDDVVSFRMDFEDWLDRLPKRDQKIAECLAVGDRTGEAAKHFHVSPSLISRKRREYRDSWQRFQGEETAPQSPLKTSETVGVTARHDAATRRRWPVQDRKMATSTPSRENKPVFPKLPSSDEPNNRCGPIFQAESIPGRRLPNTSAAAPKEHST